MGRPKGKRATKRISFLIDEVSYQKLDKIRNDTGMPIARQVELLVKGYLLKKNEPSMYG